MIFYAVVLTGLAYPLGIYMARVYEGQLGLVNGRLAVGERWFLRLVGSDPEREQNWKQYAGSTLVFTIVFTVLLYLLLRSQGHLPLNPDNLPGVSAPIALNTAASFVTNTNWQFYGGEYTMSYLTQMAGLAVQNFVSAAVGMAVLAAVIRGFARRTTSGIGNFWRDLYRSLVYILLPLAVILGIVLISQGVPQTFDGHATATTLQGGHQAIARGPVASQIAIKQLGTNGGGWYNSNSAVPFENPNGFTNFLEDIAILLIPMAQVFMFGRMVGAHAPGLGDLGRDVRPHGRRRGDHLPGRAARLAGPARLRREHHRRLAAERRQHAGQGGALRDRRHVSLGVDDHQRLQRLGERRARRAHADRRRGAARQHVLRRGDLGRRRLGPLRNVLLRPDRRLRGRPDGRAHARVPGQEDRGA